MDDSNMSPLPIRQRSTAPNFAGLEKGGVKRVAPSEISAGQAAYISAMSSYKCNRLCASFVAKCLCRFQRADRRCKWLKSSANSSSSDNNRLGTGLKNGLILQLGNCQSTAALQLSTSSTYAAAAFTARQGLIKSTYASYRLHMSH